MEVKEKIQLTLFGVISLAIMLEIVILGRDFIKSVSQIVGSRVTAIKKAKAKARVLNEIEVRNRIHLVQEGNASGHREDKDL